MGLFTITSSRRKWYEIMLWWEVRRLPYNLILALIGYATSYVGYVSIPLVYVVIGVLLNIGYGVCWIFEIVIADSLSDRGKVVFPRVALLSYSAISVVSLLVFALIIYLR